MAKQERQVEAEELVKLINSIAAVHTPSELPLILGTTQQARDLLSITGEWNEYKSGNVPGMIYDDMKSYFNEGEPGNVITGRERCLLKIFSELYIGMVY